MKQFSLLDRIRYRVDNLFARGTVALIVALALVSAAFVAVVSLIVVATNIGVNDDAPGPDFFQMMWRGLMRTLDPGTMGGDEGQIGRRWSAEMGAQTCVDAADPKALHDLDGFK